MALLAVAASGCSGADEPAAPAVPDPAPQALPGEGSPALVLTGCAGLRAFAEYPQGAAPGSAPPGWAPSPEPVVNVGVLAVGCQRIAVGPFERGPVHLVLDWHDGALAPAACMAGAPDNMDALVLGSLLVDDPEVAAYLREAHGLPARAAEVAAETATAGAADLHEWSWTADGGGSSLAVSADAALAPDQTAVRLFWPSADGVGDVGSVGNVGSLDLALEGIATVADHPALGRMAPPMLAGDFAGLGRWFPALEASGQFGDCGGGAP